ncbi:hypothetical protein DFQ27_002648 [Actinomortierella ambigua]|uniref:Uncharacterized protein n=1 Tax=Actinomortierella ambigua TaxID=1343610 RepID=A0A9P6UCL3_9FUNG|nr:hypothetical protein DFQ27_002648 [Actinomortierella ambigua]
MDNHDGRRRRIHPLKCQWCDQQSLNTRSGLAKHLARCSGVLGLEFPQTCRFCFVECQDPDGLSKHSRGCYSWEQDSGSDQQLLTEYEQQLAEINRHLPGFAPQMNAHFKLAEIRSENGVRVLALFRRRPGQSLADFIGDVHFLECEGVSEVMEDNNIDANMDTHVDTNMETNVETALQAHPYGRLVSLNEYRPLENMDPLWALQLVQGTEDNGERLARIFQEMLIQSGNDVLLAFKVEIFGAQNEWYDPHSYDLLETGRNSFKVENVFHDNMNKVMVGCLQWCVLVTLAVILTDGTVIVGPDNKFFHPKATSRIWIRKDLGGGLCTTMARHLHSKFDKKATLALYAAVNPLLNHHTTMPVTLMTLYAYKRSKPWSGIKVAAFVFHQLLTERKIVKAEVETHIRQALRACKGIPCENLKILDQMIRVMADEEMFPVSTPVNNCLTELAENLGDEITSLNNREVMEAVVEWIKSMTE